MKNTYAAVSHTDVIPVTGALVNALTKDPTIIERIVAQLPTREKMQVVYDQYLVAFNESHGMDPQKLEALEEARNALNVQLGLLHGMVNVVAEQDPSIPKSLGLTQPQPPPKKRTSGPLPLTAPQHFKLEREDGGVMNGSASAVRSAKSYEVQICEGDPSVEANWSHDSTQGKVSHLRITGLTPGKIYSFRIRAIGSHGPGPWSSYITIMAT